MVVHVQSLVQSSLRLLQIARAHREQSKMAGGRWLHHFWWRIPGGQNEEPSPKEVAQGLSGDQMQWHFQAH